MSVLPEDTREGAGTLECGHHILITTDGSNDAEDMSAMLIDVSTTLAVAKARGMLQGCMITVKVSHRHDELPPLTNTWPIQ